MVLCCGEILVDMIGSYKDGAFCYERKAGGAPFNVACGIRKFGGSSFFVGSIGDDLMGDYLEKFASGYGLCGLKLERKKNANTTLAFVELDERGERSFCFYRKNTADSLMPTVDDDLVERANIVHIGSLMLGEQSGVDYALSLADKARASHKKVSFDVNFRTDIFRNTEEAVARYKKIIETADIVKFSEEEIDIFGESYVRGLDNKLICITLGSKGSEWIFKGKTGRVPSIAVTPVDTTGAGDAFYAGLLTKLDANPEENLTPDFLNKAFAFANACGALNTLGRGAIDNLPTTEEIEKYL